MQESELVPDAGLGNGNKESSSLCPTTLFSPQRNFFLPLCKFVTCFEAMGPAVAHAEA